MSSTENKNKDKRVKGEAAFFIVLNHSLNR